MGPPRVWVPWTFALPDGGYAASVDDLIERALAEDVGDGDLTTRILIPPEVSAKAHIEQREPGVIAGLDVAAAVFARFDVKLEPAMDVVARLEGPAAGILT